MAAVKLGLNWKGGEEKSWSVVGEFEWEYHISSQDSEPSNARSIDTKGWPISRIICAFSEIINLKMRECNQKNQQKFENVTTGGEGSLYPVNPGHVRKIGELCLAQLVI